MFGTHKTREGHVMLIAAMEDSHLINFLRMLFSKVGEVKAAMALIDESASTRFANRLYGLKPISPEDGADAIRELLEKAQPYLVEAYLRGLDEPRVLLQQAMDRRAAIPKALAQLPRHDASRMFDDEYAPE